MSYEGLPQKEQRFSIEQLNQAINMACKYGIAGIGITPESRKKIFEIIKEYGETGVVLSDYCFTERELSDYSNWLKDNGNRFRGNLHKAGVELFKQYLKENHVAFNKTH